MKHFLFQIAIVSILMAAGGCDQKEMLRHFTPPADDKLARDFFGELRHGDTIEAQKLLALNLQHGDVQNRLNQLADLLKSGELKNIEVIGANTSYFSSASTTKKTVNLSYQVELSTGWLVGTVVILEESDSRAITSAHLNRIPQSLEAINRFTLSGKSSIYYIFFVSVIMVPIFSLGVLVICARSKIKKKWLWILFILVGLATFRLNWATGQLNEQLLSFQLLGASVLKLGPFAPWTISVSVPVGAIMFLLMRKKLLILKQSGPAG